MARLSKNEISTYLGDVFPIRLIGDEVERNADILWGVDGDAVSIRTFGGDGKHAFTMGALVSTVSVGEATVYALFDGARYEARVAVREMMDTELSESVGYYFADMHDHTSINHNPEEFALHEKGDICDYVDFQRKDGRLDLAVISDHACVTNDYDFFRGFEFAEGCDKPVIMAGSESEITHTEYDRFGILQRRSGEIITLMSAGYAHADTWDNFAERVNYSKHAFAIFAHPHIVGFSTKGMWSVEYARRATPFMLSLMRGIEMGNGADRKENLLHEYAYHTALDAGFHLSTTCASDSHGGRWGFDIMPGKTVILANGNSKEALHEAFLKNRFYASESGNVKLYYTVNGVPAPATLALTDEYRFSIRIGSFRPDDTTSPTVCQVISDYGKVVYECAVSDGLLEFTLNSTTARYFYLRLVDAEGRKTWSMPVWCSREFDKIGECDLSPIDLSSATVLEGGTDGNKLINGDPFDAWHSDSECPVITIDLGEEREVSAIGYYPLIVVHGRDKAPGWTTSTETRHIASRYEVYGSTDGDTYDLLTSETLRSLGVENIAEFSPKAARYIRINVLGTIGNDSRVPKYANSTASIANIALFEKTRS